MRALRQALSLLVVFILAKVLILLGRDAPFNAWAPLAYLWQDLVVVILFAAVNSLARRAWFGWGLYGAAVLYVAVNVPLTIPPMSIFPFMVFFSTVPS